jgi:probable F420-dependent oxidoreductase
MKAGFHVPQWGPSATREGVISVARAVESAGLDSIWVADHFIFPQPKGETDANYPYKERTPFRPEDGFLEGLTVLAVAAGATERIRLGTSVMVMPMRRVLETAKIASTIDVLSGGRLVLGMGAGWWKEEFEALGQPFAGRGKRFDEQLHVMRRLWREGTVAHSGDSISFEELTSEPRPIQPDGPPVLIGGMGDVSLRRAGTVGDGWHATGARSDVLGEGMAKVREHAERAGRDPASLTLSTSTVLPVDDDDTIRRMDRLHEAGVDEVVMKVQSEDIAEICAAIEHFGTDVFPRCAGFAERGQEVAR